MGFFLEIVIGGLMTGVLYSMLALNVVLIFRASGVVNFSQGAMVLFAALAMARFAEWFPQLLGIQSRLQGIILAFIGAMALMGVLAFAIERLVLRQLANAEGIALVLATLGIGYFLDGLGSTLFGSDIYRIDIGLPKEPLFLLESSFPGGVLVSKEDLYGAIFAAVLVLGLASFFQSTHTGRALLDAAHDPQAARSIGMSRSRVGVIVWSVAGLVALVAGTLLGSKFGVQSALSLVALQALPAVILGGLGSVPGAIIGGLLIGVGEKLSATYLGPTLGGGIEIWSGYVLMLLVLLVRPQGLVGEGNGGGVWLEPVPAALRAGNDPFRTSYPADLQIFPIPRGHVGVLWLIAVAAVGVPLVADAYLYSAILIPFLILSLAAIGLNILVGHCGQISLGSGAFMAVAAYAAYNVHVRIDGMPMLAAILFGGVCAMVVSLLFGIPALRIRGPYLAVATLGAHFLIDWALLPISWFSNHSPSGSVAVTDLSLFGVPIDTPEKKYLFCLGLVILFALVASSLVRGHFGREWESVRDMDAAAPDGSGQSAHATISAFAVSSFLIGVAGALWAFVYLGAWEPQAFSMDRSVQLLFMIVIGGLGSIMGSFLGAAFIVVLPIVLDVALPSLGAPFGIKFSTALMAQAEPMIMGALIVFVLTVEPRGLARLWSIGKERFELWPFAR